MNLEKTGQDKTRHKQTTTREQGMQEKICKTKQKLRMQRPRSDFLQPECPRFSLNRQKSSRQILGTD